MDDATLVRRAQTGDQTAFAALFERYAREVLRTAYLLLSDRSAAEDVMQESFVQAFRSLGKLRSPEAFRAWLYRICLREARRAAAKDRTQRLAADRCAQEPGATVLPGPHEAESEALWQAVQQLPEQQRVAVVLFYYQDRPVDEIAAVMETRPGTVKSWLHRARASLARQLGEVAPELGGAHLG